MEEPHAGWLALLRRVGPRSGPHAAVGCTVTVCRGCCCGTPGKHPGVDHAGQLARLRAAVAGDGRIRQTGCLDLCERSNVVVVSPSAAGRRNGGRPVWFAEVLDERLVTAIADWVRAGGPGLAAAPPWLTEHMVRPSRRVRHSVGG
jgi:(2Fe-2S) ferredoxin